MKLSVSVILIKFVVRTTEDARVPLLGGTRTNYMLTQFQLDITEFLTKLAKKAALCTNLALVGAINAEWKHPKNFKTGPNSRNSWRYVL